jgi:DNA-binding MarR family transcriptional regulator
VKISENDHEKIAKTLRALVPNSQTGLHFFDVRELAVLLLVASRDVIMTKEISTVLDVGKATAVGWRERAEKRDLVVSWKDGRETFTRMAPKGKRLLRELSKGATDD